ncbi:MAG: putative 4-hydroxybenzoate polyprenyltransferase [Saprospiraceae bacterium]|nr:putative 4-hydroxybenzoate polyprenyltransferase [Saprospiraceae bacterium]
MKNYLSLVKFSHTIFALPFAMLGLFLGFFASGTLRIDWMLFLKVLACMVFARSAAMAFNRYVDRDIDKINPRTQKREIPSGIITARRALLFVVLNAALFIATTYFINPICFWLSPIALLVVLGYSYTKRFTFLCHLILGLGLSLAPIGAYLAVTGYFSWLPVLYSLSVLCWVAGFDIIYALQDEGFDKEKDLYSIPARFGAKKSLIISSILHIICALLIIVAGIIGKNQMPALNSLHWIGAAIFIALLIYQHTLVGPGKLDKVNMAFFTTNGVASMLFSIFFISDLFL